jgi:hypothetical protein
MQFHATRNDTVGPAIGVTNFPAIGRTETTGDNAPWFHGPHADDKQARQYSRTARRASQPVPARRARSEAVLRRSRSETATQGSSGSSEPAIVDQALFSWR